MLCSKIDASRMRDEHVFYPLTITSCLPELAAEKSKRTASTMLRKTITKMKAMSRTSITNTRKRSIDGTDIEQQRSEKHPSPSSEVENLMSADVPTIVAAVYSSLLARSSTRGITPNTATISATPADTNSTPTVATEREDTTSTDRAPNLLTTDDIAAIVTLIVNTGNPPPSSRGLTGSTSRDVGKYTKCCH